MVQPSSQSEDLHAPPEESSPFLSRHADIGLLPFANTLDRDQASSSHETKGNMQETLLRRSTFNFPLLDRNTSIEVLPDDVLLIVFGYYRASSPTHWHRLTHVCRRWRHIVFASPRGLDLRLYCKPGTPVLKMLDYWPALPINVQYRECQTFDPPSSEDEDNIVAALKHSDRIHSITFTVTHSLLKKLRTIEQSFPELEDLVLLCGRGLPMPFPRHLRWGTRLRSLRLTGISLVTLPQLLSSSPDLIDLQLHDILGNRKLSPQMFASTLSGMTQLQSLSVQFHVFFHSNLVEMPPFSGARVVLPALTDLKFRGIRDDYLNSFIARIDAPHLTDIEIVFVYRRAIDLSPISQFIDRIEIQKSHRRADIISSGCAISMSLTKSRAPTRLELGISCRQLDWQLSSMARICDHFSQFLLSVRDLRIETTQTSSGRDAVNSERWTELIRSFSGVGRFHVAGELAADILQALRPTVGEVTSGALPALTNLYVMGPRSGAMHDVVRSIINPRKLSGSPIAGKYINVNSRNDKILQESNVEDESMCMLPKRTCRYCNVRLTEQQDLIRHSNHRAPPEECEEWCRFCRRPWPQCISAPRVQRPHGPLNAGPFDGLSISPRTHNIPGHPTEPPSAPHSLVPITRLHISESRLNRRPTEHQRGYWRFVPNLRSLGALFNSRLRRRAETAESPNDQLEPLEVWSIIGNEALE